MTDSRKLVSLVVPVYYEEQVINEFYRRCKASLAPLEQTCRFEFVFVDDGSQDRSLVLLQNLLEHDSSIRIVSFSRNFGHQMAISAGIEHAAGDALVIIDSDLQDPPEVIPAMIDKWNEGFHVVYGVRETRQGESFMKLFTAKAFYRILNALSDIDIPHDTGDFRLIDRRVADILLHLPERNRFIRGLIPWIGFRQCGVTYHRDSRYAGETKFSFRKMFAFAFDGIASFSDKPLLLAFRLGILFSLLAFALGVWLIVNKFLYPADTIFGWTSLVVVILFVGGVQLASIGMLGLYIGKIFREVKQRPLYIAAQRFGFPPSSAPESDRQ